MIDTRPWRAISRCLCKDLSDGPGGTELGQGQLHHPAHCTHAEPCSEQQPASAPCVQGWKAPAQAQQHSQQLSHSKPEAPSTLQDEPQTLGISPVSPISEQSPSRPTSRSLSVLCHGMYHHTCSVTPPCYRAGTGTGGCWGHIWGRGRDTAQTERPENATTTKRWEATPIRLFIPMLNGQGSQKAIPRLAFTTNAIKN